MKKKSKKVVKQVKKNVQKTAKKLTSLDKALSKSEVVKYIATTTGIVQKEVSSALSTLMELIELHLSKKGPGIFVLPGLAKFRIVRKPATKARKGINPFTGQPTTFAAKPARNVIKIKALKKLKDAAK